MPGKPGLLSLVKVLKSVFCQNRKVYKNSLAFKIASCSGEVLLAIHP